MHGGRKQWDRDEVLAKFKRDEFKLLVATDVMGRGLDIPTITHVVHITLARLHRGAHKWMLGRMCWEFCLSSGRIWDQDFRIRMSGLGFRNRI